jgi:pentatricopeptide repeat protein
MVAAVLQSIIKSREIKDKGVLAEQIWKQHVKDVSPQIIIYNCLMNAHSKSLRDKNRGQKAEAWLRQADKDNVHPDTFSYTSVINAYNHFKLDDAQRIFDEYRHRYANRLQVGPFCALMRVLSFTSRYQTEALMQQLLDDPQLEPTIHAFMAILKAQARGFEDGGEVAEQWCAKYTELTNEKPDEGMWTLVLHAWAKSGRSDAGRRADEIMKNLIESDTKLSVSLYNAWMDCWTKSEFRRSGNHPKAVYRVQEILQHMERDSLTTHRAIKPDSLSYSAAMQAWAKSSLPEAPQEAEELLRRMQQPRGKLAGIVPMLQCYEATMDAHARASPPGTTRIFELLTFLEETDKFKFRQRSIRSYAAALLALSRDSTSGSTTKAEAIMDRMTESGIQPNAHCYSLLATAYANNRNDTEGSHKALQVLERMKESRQPASVYVYTAVITALANRGDSDMAKQVWKETQEQLDAKYLTIVPLNAVLNALRQEATLEAAEEAEAMLRSAIKFLKPTSATFPTVMSAWAHLGRVDRTVALFDELKRDYPDLCETIAYTSVMQAYAKNNDDDDAVVEEAARQVERLLHEMEASGCRPSNVSLTTAISVYVRDDDYRDKAAALLEQMEQAYQTTGDESMKPLPEAYGYLAETPS